MEYSLLIKPASCDCNLRCAYCFYLEKTRMFGNGPHRMSQEILETLVKEYLSIRQDTHVFCWQGGEPLLAGLEFFRHAMELMKVYGGRGINVGNVLQTNGTLVDDRWAVFFREYNFLVGVSLDGPSEIHDMLRKHASGKGSYAEAVCGLECLVRHDVPVNSLTVVNKFSAEHPLEIYRHLRDTVGMTHHQYIEETAGELAVTSEQWGRFLCAVFDEWVENDVGKVSVRLFDSIINRILGGAPDCCSMRRECSSYLVVEHDGSVYPCDFHVLPEWRLGRIGRTSIAAMQSSPCGRRFARLKQTEKQCRGCQYAPYCAGDCPRNRIKNHSMLCNGYKMFFAHALPKLRKVMDDRGLISS